MDETEPVVTEPEIEMSCWSCGAKCPKLDHGVMWRCGECGSHTVRVKRVGTKLFQQEALQRFDSEPCPRCGGTGLEPGACGDPGCCPPNEPCHECG